MYIWLKAFHSVIEICTEFNDLVIASERKRTKESAKRKQKEREGNGDEEEEEQQQLQQE